MSDGYFAVLQDLLHAGIVKSVRFVMDCYSVREERRKIEPGFTIEKLRGLDWIETTCNDVIWCRGGWKSWFPWLNKQIEARRWLIFYGAGTGHQSWPHWDVVLDDTVARTTIAPAGKYTDRLWAHWRKTIPPFFTRVPRDRDYDFCLGANYVYDRKGQYIGYAALKRYVEVFGERPRVIIPGALRGLGRTSEMFQDLFKTGLAELPGHLSRQHLADVFNRTRVFVHLGTSSQGDRSPIEAGRVGCRLVLGNPRRHATYLFNSPVPVLMPKVENDLTEIAHLMRQARDEDTDEMRSQMAAYVTQEEGAGPNGSQYLRRVLSIISKYPVRDRTIWRKELTCTT